MRAEQAVDPLTYERIDLGDVELDVAIVNRGGLRGLALLVHGFPESAFSWRYQIDALADAGYEVWAPNTRGYVGSSKPPKVKNYSMDRLLGDLGALIDRSGRDAVTLVGHDWGAAQAWAFAMRRVRPLERLVIMNVPHPACMMRELRKPRQLARSWYVFFFQIPWLPERVLTARRAAATAKAFTDVAEDESRFPPEVIDVYRDGWLQPDAMRSMINYYRSALRGARAERRRGFPVIEVPTLLVWGLADQALGRETTDGTSDYVDDLTVRYLPGVSHWVQQEAPETVNEMLLTWLDGRDPPAAIDIVTERIADPALDAPT
ncbi:MAG: alpha/beta fold hydrolase [Ilumatobacteraceae bacterium]|nr:alpha/beta fold hydrolase [Ilumatobacteraceae bacterium]